MILDGSVLPNLQKGGMAVGNGIYDPFLQFPSSPIFAYMHGILSTSEVDRYVNDMNECENELGMTCA